MKCRHCRKGIHPCPSRGFPKHLDRAPCKGWVHDAGGHLAGHPAEPAESPDRPAAPPAVGPAASAPGSAAATPGTSRSPVRDMPGTSLPPGQQPGGREAQTSRSGRAAQDAAPGAGSSGVEAWRKARADHAKAQRRQRGKRAAQSKFGKASGIRIPPPGGER